MALSRTLLDASHTTASGSTLTSASVAVNAGELLTAQISCTKFSDANLPTSVTWNSIGMTKLGEFEGVGGLEAQWHCVAIYYLQVGSTATATATVTCGAANDEIALTLQKWTGFDTTTPMADFQSTSQNNSSGVAPSLTASGFASGDYILDCLATSDFVTIGANQTEVLGFDTVWDQHHSVQSGADGGAMSWTVTNDRGYVFGIGTVKVAAGGGGGTPPPFNPWPLRAPVLAQ